MNFRFAPRWSALCLIAGLAGPVAAQAADDPLAAARAEFAAALASTEAGVVDAADSERLRAYPLHPYLLAARLRSRLARLDGADNSADAAIAAFLVAQGDAPVGRDLRRAWLASLAERRQWSTFVAELPATLAASDATLRCQQFAARIALAQTEGLAPLVIAQWQAADKSLPACDTAFEWARGKGVLTPALIEARSRLLASNGYGALAVVVAKPLTPEARAPIVQWAALIDQPQAAIEALIADPTKPVERAALLDGWQRYARKNPDGAAARFAQLCAARGLDAAAASPFAKAVGLGLSWSRQPAALDWFARTQAADVDVIAAEWWARAAMWNGDWPQVTRAIALLPEASRSEQRWRYWSARAAAASGDVSAKPQLAALASEDGWYPALAAAQAGMPYAPHPQALPADEALLARLDGLPGMIRARELLRVDLRSAAIAEFNAVYDSLDAASLPQAVILPMRWGWHDFAVGTATRQKVFRDYALLYPRPYDAAVKAGATLSGLPASLIYGVLRQESLYRADAVSRANAYGLLQMLLETATRTARKWQRPVPNREALFDPDTNVPLGAAHLRDLIDRFKGQTPVAIAGYNAGPNAAARWLPAQPLPADIWIENIPFNETRNYVQRVLWHSLVFAWLAADGRPQAVEPWLAPVAGLANLVPEP